MRIPTEPTAAAAPA